MILTATSAFSEDGFRWVAAPAYEDAGAAFDGVVPLMQGGRWGLMGADGQWRVAPKFEALGAANDGHIAVKLGGLWGIIDTDGRERIAIAYQAIGRWADRIPVKTSEGWLVLDQTGARVYGPLPIDTLRGNEGHCITGQVGDRPYIFDDQYPRDGEVYATSDRAMRVYGPSGGMAAFKHDGKFGYLSCSERVVAVQEQFEAVRRVSEDGYAAVMTEGRWGLYNIQPGGAQEVLWPSFEGMRDFTEGLMPVKTAQGKWRFVDASGRQLFVGDYDQAYSFSDGAAGVKLGDKRGFVLRDGNVAAEPQFEDFWRHAKGLAPVKQGGKWGVIALDGTSVPVDLSLDMEGLSPEPPPPMVKIGVPQSYFRQDFASLGGFAFDPEARLMATWIDESEDGQPSPRSGISVWDMETGGFVGQMRIPDLQRAAFLPGGRVLAVGTLDGSVAFHEVATGKELLRKRMGHGPVTAMVLDGPQEHLVVSTAARVVIWEMTTGKVVASRDQGFHALAASGRRVWGAHENGDVVSIAPGQNDAFSRHAVAQVVPGRKRVEIGPDGTAYFGAYAWWNPDNVEQAPLLFSGNSGAALPGDWTRPTSVAFSDDGALMALVRDAGLRVYDRATGDLLLERVQSAEMQEQSFPAIDKLAFVPGTRHLAIIGSEGTPVMIYDPEAAREVMRFGVRPERDYFGVVAVTAGDKLFIGTSDLSLYVFDPTKPEIISIDPASLPEPPEFSETVPVSSDGRDTVFFDGLQGAIAIDANSLSIRPKGAAEQGAEQIEIPEVLRAVMGDMGLPDYSTRVGLLAGGKVLVLGRASGVHEFYGTESGEKLATMTLLEGQNWVVATTAGFYDGTLAGIEALSAVENGRARSVIEAMPQFHRPDVVRAVLAGGAQEAARAEAERLREEGAAVPPPSVTAPEAGLTLGGDAAAPAAPSLDLGITIEATE
ncbi:WG repeat-containing protein [Ruegeria pomeroyi]|uniref:WG repeat-containing protein n=1 Tax=Ruegeria pomeroyi TaxID=89184 RepID=A0A9Q3WMI6_9RHOB|nr:WG repeat-containing protein [Ruegeria pomeroyi]MCE8538253.1 WG repeat-containing protein [Ruegeria pomeroyi]